MIEWGTRPDEEARRREAWREIRRRDLLAPGAMAVMGLLFGAAVVWLIFR